LPLRSRKLGQEGEAVSRLRGYMLNYVVSNNFQAVEASLTYHQTLFHVTNIAHLDQWFGCRGTNSESSESSKRRVLRDEHWGRLLRESPGKAALLGIEQLSVRRIEASKPPNNGSWWSCSRCCTICLQETHYRHQKNLKKIIGWKRLKREWRKLSVGEFRFQFETSTANIFLFSYSSSSP